MSEYYFAKGFAILEWNDNNLEKCPNEVKQIIHAEETDNSYKVIKFTKEPPHTSNTINNLVPNKILHSSYIQTEFNDEIKW